MSVSDSHDASSSGSVAKTTADRIAEKCNAVRDMLIAKNKAYGNSALSPGDAESLIRIRIDDKLGRIKNNPEAFGEDAVFDLAGYLILFMLAREDKKFAEGAHAACKN